MELEARVAALEQQFKELGAEFAELRLAILASLSALMVCLTAKKVIDVWDHEGIMDLAENLASDMAAAERDETARVAQPRRQKPRKRR